MGKRLALGEAKIAALRVVKEADEAKAMSDNWANDDEIEEIEIGPLPDIMADAPVLFCVSDIVDDRDAARAKLAEALALLREARRIAHWDGTGNSRDLLGRIDAVLGRATGEVGRDG